MSAMPENAVHQSWYKSKQVLGQKEEEKALEKQGRVELRSKKGKGAVCTVTE